LPLEFAPNGNDLNTVAMQEYVREHGLTASITNVSHLWTGQLHTAGDIDYFIWNNNGDKLINDTVPPFILGQAMCMSLLWCFSFINNLCVVGNWLVHEVISAGVRAAIDGTETATVFKLNDGVAGDTGLFRIEG
jgi:hypothetical protein